MAIAVAKARSSWSQPLPELAAAGEEHERAGEAVALTKAGRVVMKSGISTAAPTTECRGGKLGASR